MSFDDVISGGIQSKSVAARGQPDTLNDSVGHYLNLIPNAYAYGTHVEFIATNHLFNIDINVTYAGTSYPSAPRTKFVQCPVRSRRAALQHTPVLRLNAKFVQYRVRFRGAGLQYS